MDEEFHVTGYSYRVTPVDDYWVIWYPELPGCSTHAKTQEEIGKRAAEVLAVWIESEVEAGHPLPEVTGDGFPAMWGADAYVVDLSEERNYLLAADIAPRLGLSRRRVNAIAQARGIGRMVGGIRLFAEDDIEALRPGPPGRPRKLAATAAD